MIVNIGQYGFPMNNYNALIIGKPRGNFCAVKIIRDIDVVPNLSIG